MNVGAGPYSLCPVDKTRETLPGWLWGWVRDSKRAASLVLPQGVPFYEGAREALVARPGVYVASA